MVGSWNHDELGWAREATHETQDGLLAPEFVVLALDEEDRLAQWVRNLRAAPERHRKPERENGRRRLLSQSHAKGDGRAEGESSEEDRFSRVAPGEMVESGGGVRLLALALVVLALASPHPPEMKSKDGEASSRQHPAQSKEELEVHRPPAQGMGVTKDGRAFWLTLGRQKERFETAHRSRDIESFRGHRSARITPSRAMKNTVAPSASGASPARMGRRKAEARERGASAH
jgi:hypothetical protein